MIIIIKEDMKPGRRWLYSPGKIGGMEGVAGRSAKTTLYIYETCIYETLKK